MGNDNPLQTRGMTVFLIHEVYYNKPTNVLEGNDVIVDQSPPQDFSTSPSKYD